MKRVMIRTTTAILAILVAYSGQAAEETAVRITKSDCILIVEHRPSADVAYQPGVDVRGRMVAPANVEESLALKDIVPKVLEFSIALNPLKGGAARFGETSLDVGTISFDMEKNRATFNGKPLTRTETRRLSRKCKEILRKSK
ncbi:MAG: hypothetical protein GKS00_12065 [Alphaproteobacteria bacterium]|nr:hypothetical protein [Alphaproteobacteria bacterium]